MRGHSTHARWPRSSGSRPCSCPRRPASCRRSASSRATSGATASSRTCGRSRRWRDLPAEGEADFRYRGQSFELTVPLQRDLAAAFHLAHEERYGYADEEREIELVAVRTAEVVAGPAVDLRGAGRRSVTGPEVVELPGATCWVPEGWSGETNGSGTLVLGRR